MNDIAVIHLVRGSNAESSFVNFLDSYRRHPAGVTHRLIVALKGYKSAPLRLERDIQAAREAGACPLVLERDDRFDIGAYIDVIGRVEANYYCFFNSFSRILAAGWLFFLYDAVRRPGIGIAGATGSWESQASASLLRFFEHPDPEQRRDPLDLARWLRDRLAFTAAPNPHLRSNSFIISREALALLRFPDPPVWSKATAHRFECARGGMTRQLLRRGLKTAVVGRDGEVFHWEEWPRSATFRAGCQRNLLIEDNRTLHYAEAGARERAWLEILAWGRAMTQASTSEAAAGS